MTAVRLMTTAEYRDYIDGTRAGNTDFLDDREYRPDPSQPMWSQGYCDGWSAAAAGAVAQEVTRR